MADKVVIDKDIVGWGNKHEEELSKDYDKILKVGIDADLPQRKHDKEIASYCKNNNCDLLTADIKAYTYYFDAEIKTIQITRYGFDKKADKHIYRIKIVG